MMVEYQVEKGTKQVVLEHIGSVVAHNELLNCPACDQAAQLIALGHRADPRAWNSFLGAYGPSEAGSDARNAFLRYHLRKARRDLNLAVHENPYC
jgi:hypothetical protein